MRSPSSAGPSLHYTLDLASAGVLTHEQRVQYEEQGFLVSACGTWGWLLQLLACLVLQRLTLWVWAWILPGVSRIGCQGETGALPTAVR